MRKLFLAGWLCLSITAILFLSCQKEANVESYELPALQTSITVSEAQAWFTDNIVKKEKEMLDQPYDVLPAKSPQRLFARMGKLQKKIIWEDSKIVNREGMQYMVVPIVKNQQLRSDAYEIERSFIFYKDKEHKIKMNVVEVMSEKGKTLSGKSPDIIATAFDNRMTAKNKVIQGVGANVFFYNDTYQSLNSYEMKNGVWKESNVELSIIENPGTQTGVAIEVSVCETYYVVQFFYENGVLVHWEMLYSYQECSGGGSGDEELEQPGGSGDGGGGGSTSICNMNNDQAQSFLNAITISHPGTFSYSSGAESAPDNAGIIRKTTNQNWSFLNINFGAGYYATYTSYFSGVVYKTTTNSQWKFESFGYISAGKSSGSEPPCVSVNLSVSSSSPMISTDKLTATVGTMSYSAPVVITCFFGVKTQTFSDVFVNQIFYAYN